MRGALRALGRGALVLLREGLHVVLTEFERRTQGPLPSDWHAIAEHEIEVDLEIKRERAGQQWP